jgi:hypothetical protein
LWVATQVAVVDAATAGVWDVRLTSLFRDLRDPAVHPEEQMLPAVSHPSGVNTSKEHARYTAEGAQDTVTVLGEWLALLAEAGPAPGSWAAYRPNLSGALTRLFTGTQ